MEDIKFDSEYVMWYHSIEDKSWENDSYTNLCEDLPNKTITTAHQMWSIFKVIGDMSAGMFFLMRKGVFPTWEDPQNRNGGYWSAKLTRKETPAVWDKLCAGFVGNTLGSHITGISISPKITNCIVKIWTDTCEQLVFNTPLDLRFTKNK